MPKLDMMKTAGANVSKRLVLMNSASSLATRMLSISVLVWLQQYLLKRITPEEYSLLPLLYSVMMFAPLVTTILTGGLGRYIVEAYARNDEERVTQIVSTMFPILCATGLLFVTGGWTFAWYIGSVLNIAPERLWDARVMMAMLMFSAAIRLPLSPFGVGLYVRQKFVLQNIIAVGTELFRLTLLFGLLFGVSTRIVWVIAASFFAELLNLAITFDISRRALPMLRFRISDFRWPIAKEIMSFGGWSFAWNVADTVRTSADIIILNKLATPLDVACFHLGSIPLRHMQQASYAIRGPLAPVITTWCARNDRLRLRQFYLQAGRYALWASLFVCVPVIIYGHDLITLYVGETYANAATVLSLLLTLFPVVYGSVMLPELAQATARVRPYAVRQLAMNGINLLLTVYLVGTLHMGAVGSALATFASLLLFFPLFFWPLGLQLAGLNWREWFFETLAPGLLPSGVAAIVWGGLRWLVQPGDWLSLCLCGAGGCLIYIFVLLALCLQCKDKDILKGMYSHTALFIRESPASLARLFAVYAVARSKEE